MDSSRSRSSKTSNLALQREIELLHVKINHLREAYAADKLQIGSRKKRLENIFHEFTELEKKLRTVQEQKGQNRQGLLRSRSLSLTYINPYDEKKLAELIRYSRKENEVLAAEVVKNDVLVRLGPHMGTLALRIKRSLEARRLAELQSVEAEARQEVTTLTFHLRNEEMRLQKARMLAQQPGKREVKQQEGPSSPVKNVALLFDTLEKSRSRINLLAFNVAEAYKEEERIDAKLNSLRDF